jgi:hypothetical protein
MVAGGPFCAAGTRARSAGLRCRDGTPSAGQLSSINQYNHQAGTLHLPLGEGARASPVAIQVRPQAGSRACIPALACK